jgi:hypothetical protein
VSWARCKIQRRGAVTPLIFALFVVFVCVCAAVSFWPRRRHKPLCRDARSVEEDARKIEENFQCRRRLDPEDVDELKRTIEMLRQKYGCCPATDKGTRCTFQAGHEPTAHSNGFWNWFHGEPAEHGSYGSSFSKDTKEAP